MHVDKISFLMHVDKISMDLLILYFKGSHVHISKLCISVVKVCFFIIIKTVLIMMKYCII